jgi:hypothetical protein
MAEPDVVVVIWQEQRSLPGGNATVSARVAQPAGVGWVDLAWVMSVRLKSQRHRLLADWAGGTDAEMARAVISLADDWFAYCAEQAEREQVVGALADPSGGLVPTASATDSDRLQRAMTQFKEARYVESRSSLNIADPFPFGPFRPEDLEAALHEAGAEP